MHKRSARGLTLIELMMTVALLVIVIAIGVPGMQGAINGGRLSSAANELSAAVLLARAERVDKLHAICVSCGASRRRRRPGPSSS